MRTIFTLFVLSCCLIQGCNPTKLLESGKPKRAYTVSLNRIEQRLKQNKPLKDAHLEALGTSYGLLQDEEIRRIETIETNRAPDRHLELYPIYQQLLKRRLEIEPYLPLLHYLDPRYDIPSLEALTERSRQRAGSYCYAEAAKLFPEARAGDKPAARAAFYWLEKSLAYVPEALENETLKAEMMDIGTTRVLIVPNESNVYNGGRLTERIFLHQGTAYLYWLEIHFSRPDSRIDYLLHMEVAQVDLGFDQEYSNITNYSKEIIDGYKTVEKEVRSGDSTIVVKEEVPIIITVHGAIKSVEQYKIASASLYAHLTTPDGDLVVNEWNISKTVDWSNRYEECSGDSRALPRSCCGSWTLYPFDSDMLRDLSQPIRNTLLQDVAGLFPVERVKKVKKRKDF